MFRFGVISAYPAEDWHASRLVEALETRGSTKVFSPSAFTIRVEGSEATVYADGQDVRDWDVWLTPRAIGPQGDPEFQCGAYKGLSELDVPVVNPISALLAAKDKVRTSWLLARAGIATPEVIAAQSLAGAQDWLEGCGEAVLKPPYGSLGIGVVRVRAGDAASRRALGRALSRYGVAYLQRFVRSRRRPFRDLRLFVVGGRVAAAIERVARRGEFRANVHLGARARRFWPKRACKGVAVAAARALGLEYAGVDLVDTSEGPTVLEINGTPRWDGILSATGRDMAEEIAAHAAVLGRRQRKNREERSWQTRRKGI